jgi:hypothetical protein
MTVGIAYSGGTYGTYLEWCLTTLSSKNKLPTPFLPNGNSHKFGGNMFSFLFDEPDISNCIENLDFFRFHTKHNKKQSLSHNLTTVCNLTQSLIHLYPDRNSVLLCINNEHSKIFDNWWTAQFEYNFIDPNEVYKNWPIDPDLKINQVPRWIQREFLSFYLMPAWFDRNEWYHPDSWQHDKCIVITVRELLDNFENTLVQLEQFCNLTYKKPVAELLYFHQENLQNQQYLDEDVLCNQIVTSVVDGKDFSWSPRSLVSESWIQWQLRNLGYEVRCHELDTFPTNSVHLRELIYPV